ncbi:MAG: response regulator [Bacteroidales bacterium]|nr:response regulator [Candidatus Hennigimonas equi]
MLIFISGNSHAQNYYFRNFSAGNGLPSNTTTCGIQDSRGFMWFGTKDGICRYDGASFKLFGDEPAQDCMNGMTWSLCEDRKGMIWFSCARSLGYYDPFTGCVTECMNDRKARSTLLCDKNGDVWFVSRNEVFRIPDGDFSGKEEISCGFSPLYACLDKDGTVWMSSREGALYRYGGKKGFEAHWPMGRKPYSIGVIAAYGSGHIVFNGNDGRIYAYDLGDGGCRCIISGFPEPTTVNCLKTRSNGDLWIGCLQGLYIYSPDKQITGPIKDDHITSIQNTNVTFLCSDNRDNVWLGTYHGGISLWHNRKHHISQFIPMDKDNCLKGKLVRAITGDTSGNVWVGTEDGHLNYFNLKKETVCEVNRVIGLPDNLNYHCFLNDGNRMWIATFGNGVYLVDRKKFRLIRHYDVGSNSCICIRKTSDGSVYAGTSTGMYVYDPASDSFARFTHIPQAWIHDIFEDSEGTLWVGSFGSGIFYRGKTGNVFTHIEKGEAGLECNYILNFFEDAAGKIWIATEGGGICHTTARGQKSFTHISRKNGMPSNISCATVQDRRGLLWISTTKGLVEFNPETERIEHIYRDNGIMGSNFCYGASFVSEDGQIHLGTTRGLMKINPKFLSVKDESKPVYIVDVTADVNGRRSSLHEEGKSTMMSENFRAKSRGISYLSIRFACPNFTDIAIAPEYEYTLKSRKGETKAITEENTVVFSDLSPGHYTFSLRLADADASIPTKIIGIDILPPLWKSPLALTIYAILLLAFLIYFVLTVRRKRERDRQHEMFRMEADKQKEIADAKIGFFTNITHEIRTPLSLIKMPIERIIAEKEYTEASKDDIMTIQANTDRLLNLTNQLLDIRKIEKKDFTVKPSEFEISGFVANLAKRFSPGIRERHLSYTENLGDKDINVVTDAEFLEKIICNLLSNAVKYSKSSIEVSLRLNEGYICITVDSDGEIMQDSEAENIFKPFYQVKTVNSYLVGSNGTGLGLPYARQLANALGGRLYLDTSNRTVNSFVLEIPAVSLHTVQKQPEVITEPTEDREPELIQECGNHWILVVEDSAEMNEYLCKQLEKEYTVLSASNGEEAVSVIQNNKVDLVVSDIMMPVMDGCQLCNYIKGNIEYSHIPIILLTAAVGVETRIETLDIGADGYIEKPFSMDLLRANIANLFKNKEIAYNQFANSPLSHFNSTVVNNIDKDFMDKLHDAVMSNIADQDLDIEKLVKIMVTSKSTLYRKVKANTGVNINEYIRICRLKKAAELLAMQKYRINEVAYLTGFSSPSYFTTSFQKQFHQSPSTFLKNIKVN